MQESASLAREGIATPGDEWLDYRWRLSNLYWIVDEKGRAVPFKPNPTQLDFLGQLWFLNLILKSRQHGFTTLIDLLALDSAVWLPNFAAGIIAHNLSDAQGIFRNKVKFAYDRLPDGLKAAVYPTTNSTQELVLSNGSSVRVGTSLRGSTLQLLHVSEFGKISRRYPEKAREIVTGAFNTVHPGQFIFVESTAEGRDGHFYQMVQRAEKHAQAGRALTKMDFKLHFYPWWQDPRNRMAPAEVAEVPIPDETRRYFADLERGFKIKLDAAQRAWYVKKSETQEGDMKREHPSTPGEAFEGAVKGAIYGEKMEWLRRNNHLRPVPWVPSEPVNTFWDLGRNNDTAIWFHQFIAAEHRFIRYHANSMKDLAYYVLYMQDECRGYVWGDHYLPHDGDQENLERGESRVDRLVELGLDEQHIKVVERVEDIGVGIELTRKMLPLAYFDVEGCDKGIQCLDGYQYEWDDKGGVFRNVPAHNWASNGADALRQWAQGWQPGRVRRTGRKSGKKRDSWRTA